MSPPRVRFAPAPTGYLHVGGARSALFNWLYARQTGGTFVLRVEDTDQERSRPELTDQIVSSLEWLGIDWDEGPVHQSERRDLYRAAVEKLLADGSGYLVDADDRPVDGTALADGLAVRFRVPDAGATRIDDVVRGEVVFEHADIEDFVVWRSNGTPTFLIANAVDDADLGITHVIRGEDLLSSTPRVLLLREAIGRGSPPVYAHLPLLVNDQRQKLSKRRDDVAVGDYRERGYLPEAVANYLAFLGWGPPDGVEVRPMDEIVELFRLEDVTKAPAFFDLKKLDSFNGDWIRRLDEGDFIERATPWVAGIDGFDPTVFATIAPLVQERVAVLAEVPDQVDWLFLREPPRDEKSWDKAMKPPAAEILEATIDAYGEIAWESDALHEKLRSIGEGFDLKLGKAQAPVRVAVTGRTVGPPLFESLMLLGRDETLRRLRTARDAL